MGPRSHKSAVAGGKKAAATQKEKYGDDFHRRIGAVGGKRSTRGGLGYLKDTDPERFKAIQQAGAKKAGAANKRKGRKNSGQRQRPEQS